MQILTKITVACGCLAVAASAAAANLRVAVHDGGARSLMDAVVYAEPIGAAAPASREVAHATIDQINKEFVPLVTVVRTNTEITFPNSDNFRHSIYSFSEPKAFATRLYSGKHAPPVLFDKPGVVVLGCNIHDMMAAWVVVVDTPYFGKTSSSGTSVLTGLPPGDYRVSVWYPGPVFKPTTSQVHLGADGADLDVRVDSSASMLPMLRARAGTHQH